MMYVLGWLGVFECWGRIGGGFFVCCLGFVGFLSALNSQTNEILGIKMFW